LFSNNPDDTEVILLQFLKQLRKLVTKVLYLNRLEGIDVKDVQL
jgi:hypothetical protein